jgi:hypothetical protein
MKQTFESLDSELKNLGLKRVETAQTGAKIVMVGIENENLNLKITITWHSDIIVDCYEGTCTIDGLCDILNKLKGIINKLKL